MRRPRAVCSRWRIAEVLPATRKPVMTVAGIFPAGAPAFLEETSDIAYLPFLRCPEGEPEAAPDQAPGPPFRVQFWLESRRRAVPAATDSDRKSTRLNSSH